MRVRVRMHTKLGASERPSYLFFITHACTFSLIFCLVPVDDLVRWYRFGHIVLSQGGLMKDYVSGMFYICLRVVGYEVCG